MNEWFPVAYTLDGGAVIARVAEVVAPSDEDWKTAAPQITDAVAQRLALSTASVICGAAVFQSSSLGVTTSATRAMTAPPSSV